MRCASLLLAVLTAPAALLAQDMPLSQVLIDGEGWKLVSEGHQFTEGLAADEQGNVFFVDVPKSQIFRIDAESGEVRVFDENTGKASGLAFAAEGRLLACETETKKLVCYDRDARPHDVAEDLGVNDLAVDRHGGVYVTDMGGKQVWYVSRDGTKSIAAKGFTPNGLTFWPDGKTLVISDWEHPHLWTFRVDGPGELTFGEKYYGPVQTPPDSPQPGSDGMTVDDTGRLFVCTRQGLQMFDPTGRQSGTIAKPQPKFLSNVKFGGKSFDTLYVTCSDKVYSRKTQTKGTPLAVKSSK